MGRTCRGIPDQLNFRSSSTRGTKEEEIQACIILVLRIGPKRLSESQDLNPEAENAYAEYFTLMMRYSSSKDFLQSTIHTLHSKGLL